MTTSQGIPVLENTFARELPDMYEAWSADEVNSPKALVINESLAIELGLDVEWLLSEDGASFLVGNSRAPGSTPIAQAYAGHQFGGFSPRLGDGRALLLGEHITPVGSRVDFHLKGSGRTRFSRGGDGKAAVGPMLREYVISEAMHALGIPTTRALSVVATNQTVRRDEMLPGAVLCRVASSHLRVGSFQYAASLTEDHVARLVNYSIARHLPEIADAPNRAVALFESVLARQAKLIAQWMSVGFIHGVMNTDNMTISGETLDYGPCAFMDSYDPKTVFSSIDHGGRYAFGNQPYIAQWNLARFAETLLPLMHEHEDQAVDIATELVNRFPERFEREWHEMMCEKLGLPASSDVQLVHDLLSLFESQKVDYTNGMRALSDVVRGNPQKIHSVLTDISAFESWSGRWLDAVGNGNRIAIADAMDRANPSYIPRNHLVEIALAAGSRGDLAPVNDLVAVLADPFTERAGLESYTQAMPADWEGYQTFCGT